MDFVSAANWYIKQTGTLSVMLAALGLIGIPAVFGVVTTTSYAQNADMGVSSRMIFWICFYLALGAVILLFVVGERLRIFKYQRPTGEPTIDALGEIFNHPTSTIGTKGTVILFCTSYHCLVGSIASSVGAALAQRFVLGLHL